MQTCRHHWNPMAECTCKVHCLEVFLFWNSGISFCPWDLKKTRFPPLQSSHRYTRSSREYKAMLKNTSEWFEVVTRKSCKAFSWWLRGSYSPLTAFAGETCQRDKGGLHWGHHEGKDLSGNKRCSSKPLTRPGAETGAKTRPPKFQHLWDTGPWRFQVSEASRTCLLQKQVGSRVALPRNAKALLLHCFPESHSKVNSFLTHPH